MTQTEKNCFKLILWELAEAKGALKRDRKRVLGEFLVEVMNDPARIIRKSQRNYSKKGEEVMEEQFDTYDTFDLLSHMIVNSFDVENVTFLIRIISAKNFIFPKHEKEILLDSCLKRLLFLQTEAT